MRLYHIYIYYASPSSVRKIRKEKWTHLQTIGNPNRDSEFQQESFGTIGNAGISGMLHYAVGIWPSRDNVWTNRSVADHGGPEPMVSLSLSLSPSLPPSLLLRHAKIPSTHAAP